MKKRNYRLFMKLLRESAGWFSGAALLTVLSVFLGFLTPAVLAEVLDHVLGGEPTRMPGFVSQWVNAAGGREYLRANLWLPGAALVFISLLNGVSSLLRGRWTAQGAENPPGRCATACIPTCRNSLQLSHPGRDRRPGAALHDDVDTVRRFRP